MRKVSGVLTTFYCLICTEVTQNLHEWHITPYMVHIQVYLNVIAGTLITAMK